MHVSRLCVAVLFSLGQIDAESSILRVLILSNNLGHWCDVAFVSYTLLSLVCCITTASWPHAIAPSFLWL